jgi:hypothetical protein
MMNVISQRFPLPVVLLAAAVVTATALPASPSTGTAPAPQERVFFGNLHSHTAFSDGSGTPAEAYTHARDVADLDFLALTEHNHAEALGSDNLGIGKDAALYNGPGTNSLIATATRMTEDGRFVALYGQEFSTISTGNHVNRPFHPRAAGHHRRVVVDPHVLVLDVDRLVLQVPGFEARDVLRLRQDSARQERKGGVVGEVPFVEACVAAHRRGARLLFEVSNLLFGGAGLSQGGSRHHQRHRRKDEQTPHGRTSFSLWCATRCEALVRQGLRHVNRVVARVRPVCPLWNPTRACRGPRCVNASPRRGAVPKPCGRVHTFLDYLRL